MQDNSFDKNIKYKLEGLDIQPSQKVWAAVEKELDRKKRRYFFLWWLLPLLIIGGGAVWYTASRPDSSKENNVAKIELPESTTGKTGTAVNQKLPSDQLQQKEAIVEPGNKKEDIAGVAVQPKTKTTAGKTTLNITGVLVDDENIKEGKEKTSYVAGKTKAAIKPAIPQSEEEEPTGLNIIKNDTAAVVLKDVLNKASDSVTIAETKTQPEEPAKPSQGTDSLLTKESKKEKHPSSSKWDKQWNIGGGYAGLGTLKIGSFSDEALYNNGSVPNPGSGSAIRISNKYAFNNGIYLNAGLFVNRKLTGRIKLATGIQYNFQHINVSRKYIIDSIALSSTPSYTNVSTTTYKEALAIHAIDIPVLAKFSLSGKISLSTGIFNRFQFSSQWKKYEHVLGTKETYLPLFHFNPEYSFRNFSLGPAINIGLTQYNNGSRLLNFGLSLKYSPKK